VLNDLDALKSVCRATGTKVCVDAVSAFGLTPVGFDDVYFASVVSGKGARAFAGLAMVLYNHDLEPSDRLPRYCDLGLYARSDGVPFTHSSNLVRALSTALSSIDWDRRFRSLINTSAWLRGELRRSGFRVVAPESHAAPGVVTIGLPRTVQSTEVAARLEHAGFALASNSEYLRERNWIQISLMGEPPVEQLREVVEALRLVCAPPGL
jgi:aspartate aminotransferase-like enzyme